MTTFYLGLGSNLGDRLGLLATGVAALQRAPGVQVSGGSAVYESAPVGVTEQPDFLNLVISVETSLPPPDLLALCLATEAACGRIRTTRWGPRTLDLDVLLADGLEWNDDRLTLPHPRMQERAFVMIPLAELAPELTLNGESIRTHAQRLDAASLRLTATWPDLLRRGENAK